MTLDDDDPWDDDDEQVCGQCGEYLARCSSCMRLMCPDCGTPNVCFECRSSDDEEDDDQDDDDWD